MHVSVAICTWNRAELLRLTLDQLTRMEIPHSLDWELIIVNNNCTDHTDDVIRTFAGRLPIRRLFEPSAGKPHASNLVIRKAESDHILFTDDDVLVDREWLKAFVEAAGRYPEAAAIGGPIDPWFPHEPDARLLEAFPILARGFCGLDHERSEGPLPEGSYVWGANMAINRPGLRGQLFNTSLGPSPTSPEGGDELELLRRVRRLGGTVVWTPEMRVRHYVDSRRMELPYLKKFQAGIGRNRIRLEGVPPGTRIAGVPRWLVRTCGEKYLRYLTARLLNNPAEALLQLREYSELRGMIEECFLRARRSDGDGGSPQTTS